MGVPVLGGGAAACHPIEGAEGGGEAPADGGKGGGSVGGEGADAVNCSNADLFEFFGKETVGIDVGEGCVEDVGVEVGAVVEAEGIGG